MGCIGGFFSFLSCVCCIAAVGLFFLSIFYFIFVRVFFPFLFGGIAGGAGRCWGLEEEEVTF